MLIFNTTTTKKKNLVFNAPDAASLSTLAPSISTTSKGSTAQLPSQVGSGADMLQTFLGQTAQMPLRATAVVTKSINNALGIDVLPSLADSQQSFTGYLTGTAPIKTVGELVKETQSGLRAFGIPDAIAGPWGAFAAGGGLVMEERLQSDC